MSLNDDHLPDPPDRYNRYLPPPSNERNRVDDNIIDGDYIETGNYPDDGWTVNQIFDNLWSDVSPDWQQSRSNMVPPSEQAPRASRPKSNRPPQAGQDYIERAAQMVHEELNKSPQDHEVIVALIRGKIGWYLFFNRNYQKSIPIILIISILFVTGKISQALELFFKLFF